MKRNYFKYYAVLIGLLSITACQQNPYVELEKQNLEGVIDSIKTKGDAVILTIKEEDGDLQGITVKGTDKIRNEHGDALELASVNEDDKVLVIFKYKKGELPKMLKDKHVEQIKVNPI